MNNGLNFNNFSLLVVDDEKVILDILKDFLSLEGFKVTIANCGEDAMELLHKEAFDLVITDLKMPGISGLDLLKHITERFNHTVTVVMTGFGTLETAIDSMKSGAYDYILKPFKVDEVVHIVKRGLEKKALEEENIQLKETISLYNTTQAINSSLSLENIFTLLLDSTFSLVNCDLAALYTRSSKTKKMELKKLKSNNSSSGIEIVRSIPTEKLLIEHKKKIPVLQAKDKLDDLSYLPKELKIDIQSFCSVPLTTKNKIIGFLNIYSSERITEGQRKTLSLLADRTAIAIENATLYSNLQQHFFQTIDGFLKAIEAKDGYTRGHSERVRKYCEMIGRVMKLETNYLKIISQAALLHDIGKISVDLSELNHPGKLNAKQRDLFRLHPTIGKKILEPIGLLSPVIPIVYHHHENYDGSGYPLGLKAEQIPLGARILAIADSYDAMTSDRAYRKALSSEKAMEELRTFAGKQFDPEIVDHFLEALS